LVIPGPARRAGARNPYTAALRSMDSGFARSARASEWRNPSPALHALRIDVERIQRVRRCHEQAVALDAAETQIGAALRQRNMADRLALRREHAHAVELGGHAPAAPQIAVDIAAETVRRAARAGVDDDAAVGDLVAVADHVIGEDAPRLAARLDDVEDRLVRRESEAVRRIDAVGGDRHRTGLAVDAVDVHRQFRLGHIAFVIAEDAELRIGEPDRTVRLDHDVVRRIQALALEAVADDGDRAVIFGARDAAREMLAGDEP